MEVPPLQRVIKVGDSLAVVIPRAIRMGLEVQRGDVVALSALRADVITIKLFTKQEIEKMRLPVPPEE